MMEICNFCDGLYSIIFEDHEGNDVRACEDCFGDKFSSKDFDPPGNRRVATYKLGEIDIDVDAVYDDRGFSHYDLFWQGTCINEGDPIYPDAEIAEDVPPTISLVKDFLEDYLEYHE